MIEQSSNSMYWRTGSQFFFYNTKTSVSHNRMILSHVSERVPMFAFLLHEIVPQAEFCEADARVCTGVSGRAIWPAVLNPG